MNAKAKVLAAYPTAESVTVECFDKTHFHAAGHRFKRIIVMAHDGGSRTLGESVTVADAWDDAAARVEEERE